MVTGIGGGEYRGTGGIVREKSGLVSPQVFEGSSFELVESVDMDFWCPSIVCWLTRGSGVKFIVKTSKERLSFRGVSP